MAGGFLQQLIAVITSNSEVSLQACIACNRTRTTVSGKVAHEIHYVIERYGISQNPSCSLTENIDGKSFSR